MYSKEEKVKINIFYSLLEMIGGSIKDDNNTDSRNRFSLILIICHIYSSKSYEHWVEK